MAKAPILIADPDSRALALTANGLRKEGFEVLSASRGEDALAMLQSQPSLVFCEVGLEGLDGYTLCENLRRAPATRETPIILIARREAHEARERAQACGADDLLFKPCYLRDLCTLAHLFADVPHEQALLEGDLADLPLFYLLRALTSGTRSGSLELTSEPGKLHFRDGRIVEATAGSIEGEAAVSRLLMLAQGGFALRLAPVLLRGSINYSLRDLVTHDEPRRRRFGRAMEQMGGPEACLTIDFAALTRELPRLPASLEQIVRLFDGQRQLVEVLRACDLDEVTAAEAVLRLFAIRVLRPAADLAEPAPADAPRLFEPRPDEALLTMRELFPDARPQPVEAQPEPTADAATDWTQEIGKGTELSRILEAGTGGWLELPAERVGEELRTTVGELSDKELDRRLEAFDDPDVPKLPDTQGASSATAEPATPTGTAPPTAAGEAAAQPAARQEDAAAPASAEACAPAPATTPGAAEPASAAPVAVAAAEATPAAGLATRLPPGGTDAAGETEEAFFTSRPEFDEDAPVPPPSLLKPVLVVGACAVVAFAAVLLAKPSRSDRAAPAQPVAAQPAPPKQQELPTPREIQPAVAGPELPAPAPSPAEAATAASKDPSPSAAPTEAAAAPPVAPPSSAAVPAAAAAGTADQLDALVSRGKALYEQGRATAALVPLQQAADLAPGDANVQVLLALARLDAGKLQPAAQAARRALEIEPDNARAHLVLGTVHQEEGDKAAAKTEYQEYLRLAPRGEFAGDVKALLAGMK